MPRISSRPFNGQLGSAIQTSNIILDDGKNIKLQDGIFSVRLECHDGGDRLRIKNDALTLVRDVDCRSVFPSEVVDSVDVLSSWMLSV